VAEINPVAIGVTSLLVLEGAKLFRDLAPPLADVRKASPDGPRVGDVRVAEVAAGAIVVLAGVCVGSVSHSSAPVYVSVATVALLIGLYEWTLARQ
jgi:hypothetical protein